LIDRQHSISTRAPQSQSTMNVSVIDIDQSQGKNSGLSGPSGVGAAGRGPPPAGPPWACAPSCSGAPGVVPAAAPAGALPTPRPSSLHRARVVVRQRDAAGAAGRHQLLLVEILEQRERGRIDPRAGLVGPVEVRVLLGEPLLRRRQAVHDTFWSHAAFLYFVHSMPPRDR